MISTLLKLSGSIGPFPRGRRHARHDARARRSLASERVKPRDAIIRPSHDPASRSRRSRRRRRRPPPTVPLARVLRVVAVAAARVDADMRGREEVSRGVLYERSFGRRARDVTDADE